MVCQLQRFYPSCRWARDGVHPGQVGKAISFDASTTQNPDLQPLQSTDIRCNSTATPGFCQRLLGHPLLCLPALLPTNRSLRRSMMNKEWENKRWKRQIIQIFFPTYSCGRSTISCVSFPANASQTVRGIIIDCSQCLISCILL